MAVCFLAREQDAGSPTRVSHEGTAGMFWAVSSAGRALPSQGRGREFESPTVHSENQQVTPHGLHHTVSPLKTLKDGCAVFQALGKRAPSCQPRLWINFP